MNGADNLPFGAAPAAPAALASPGGRRYRRRVTDPSPSPASDAPSLWAWVLRAMAEPTVRRAVLTLQDAYGMSGSLVLWCAWAPRAGCVPGEATAVEIARHIEAFDRFVVRRLREVRRHLASPRPGYAADGVAGLRREVYEAELAGERLLLTRLEAETRACPDADAPEDRAAAAMGLFTLCRDNLELPVLLADDLGDSGPAALFAQVDALAPAASPQGAEDG